MARRQVIASNGRAKDGRPLEGGIHVHGLCESCNGRAGQWDPAYIALHRALSPPYFAESRLQLPARIATPDVQIDLGAAVRSMLAAAFALNPGLRSKACPELADLLLRPNEFTMPSNLEVRLAWAIGRLARVTGHYVLGYNGLNRTTGTLIAAQVHYPPIAWRLVFAGETDLCDLQGWADISLWTEHTVGATASLRDAVGSLPPVYEARSHPEHGEGWMELLNDEICHMVVSHDIAAVGRNESCPCGSGTKFKRCCGPGNFDPASRRSPSPQ